ncbi:MAG: hypothetical protein PHP45_04480 [Elusimicrobiales bacterium]|nr:hypothetical protein [Elusimicrobiales bacterium]
MIITKTPLRISFVGGGSDMEEFYSRKEGAVLSVAINKYMYLSSHHFFDRDKIRVKYAKTETVADISQLQHPIVREALRQFRINGALEISSNSDVPAGTGLGSSSAFTVGLLHNLYTRSGKFATKETLAAQACDIEINRLGEPIGRQDQYACAYGGLNVVRFMQLGDVMVEPLHLGKQIYKTLQSNLLLFYTGDQRLASAILSEQKKNAAAPDKAEILSRMVELVWKLRDALYSGDLRAFGGLLHENWLLKKRLASGITNPAIDALYEKGLANGASGGKLLGAGGGGFLLFYCEPENQAGLRSAFSDHIEMKFKFDSEGSKVIYAADEYLER